jgi:hypothetical protein
MEPPSKPATNDNQLEVHPAQSSQDVSLWGATTPTPLTIAPKSEFSVE